MVGFEENMSLETRQLPMMILELDIFYKQVWLLFKRSTTIEVNCKKREIYLWILQLCKGGRAVITLGWVGSPYIL